MSSQRVAVLRSPREIVLERRPIPAPGPDEVLVRVSAVGVCGSDVHYYEHGRMGQVAVTAPLALGHEPAGAVVEVGDAVTRVRPGQRVSVEPGRPDFTCAECRAGRYNLCRAMSFLATPPVDGAFAEFLVVHEAQAHPVPDPLSDDAAALLEPLSVAIWAAAKAEVRPGDRVLVTGAGPIGLLCAQMASIAGAVAVTVADVNRERLASAARFGATATLDVGRGGSELAMAGADVLLECTGHPVATRSGIEALAPAGRAVLVGSGSSELALDLGGMQRQEIRLTGTHRYAHTWPTAIELAASGRVDLDALVTGHYGLEEAEDALTATARDSRSLKSVVRPGVTGTV